MKKTDKINYIQKTTAELQKLLVTVQKNYIEARAKQTVGNLKDTSIFKKLKYEIALIKTLLNKKQND
jgi:ribosomal protein L29